MGDIAVEDAVGAVEGNYRRWMECSRKRPYHSRKVAEDNAKGIRKLHGRAMEAYCCSHCGKWHLATARGKKNGKG